MHKKILLTGSTGFIGYNIALWLLKDGYNVRMLVRTSTTPKHLKHQNVEYIMGDIKNYDDVEKAMKDCDIVIHTAGLFTFDNVLKEEIYKVNINGTENICKAVVANKIKKFIYTSSAATIGKANTSLSDENTKFNLWNISSHYKKSKVLAENIVWKYYQNYNIPVVILNPSLPLGYYDFRPTPTGMMVKSFLQCKKILYINGGFNFVHINDVAKAHLLAITKGKVGEKYIIGCENLLLKSFYLKLNKYKPDVKLIKIPYFIALCCAWLNSLLAIFTKKQPLVTIRGVQLSKKKMFYNNSKSIRDLGMQYTPIDKAIEDSINWFKNNK